MQLAQAYATCEDIIRTHSSSFYHAFSTLAQAERSAVFAVYAFCRHVDHIADGPLQDAGKDAAILRRKRLDSVESELLSAAHLGIWPSHDAVWCALCDVFARYPMSFDPFFSMIKGQRFDLAFRQPETLFELEQYCYLVAGTVGLMLLPILAPSSSVRLRRAAVALGVAMQLTNILRDVREDALMGRIYLPGEWLRGSEVATFELQADAPPAQWPSVAARLARRARSLYRLGLLPIRHYPPASRLPVAAAAAVYSGILDAIAEREWDVFRERVYLSDERKRTLVAQALCNA